MPYYKSHRYIDGKVRLVILDEEGKILNKNPKKEELKGLKFIEIEYKGKKYSDEELLSHLKIFYKENGRNPIKKDFDNSPIYPSYGIYQQRFGSWNKSLKAAGLYVIRHSGIHDDDSLNYNDTNTCEFVENDGIRCMDKLYPKNARKFIINEMMTWYCEKHGNIYRQKLPNSQHNIMKSIGDRRTGNQDKNSSNAKGDSYQELACLEFGWSDLNKENDNYNFSIDCLDSKTGLFYQVKGRRYNPKYGHWNFAPLKVDWQKEYSEMICYCMSKDGMTVERIYRFPKEEIDNKTSISIYKDPTDRYYNNIIPWYEQYRIKDEEELKNANKIWKQMNK